MVSNQSVSCSLSSSIDLVRVCSSFHQRCRRPQAVHRVVHLVRDERRQRRQQAVRLLQRLHRLPRLNRLQRDDVRGHVQVGVPELLVLVGLVGLFELVGDGDHCRWWLVTQSPLPRVCLLRL